MLARRSDATLSLGLTLSLSLARRHTLVVAGLVGLSACAQSPPAPVFADPLAAGNSAAGGEPEAPRAPEAAGVAVTPREPPAVRTPVAWHEISAKCPTGLEADAERGLYVCDCAAGAAKTCRAGNDAGPGSKASPWRSYEHARQAFAKLPAGGTIAFCRGGAFEADTRSGSQWINPQCKAAEPCVVRDYRPDGAPENVERPLFTFKGRGGFSFADAGDADHEEGYIFLNLRLRGNDVEAGFFAASDVDDVLMCNMEIEGFDIGVHVAGSNPTAPGSDGLNERVVLRNSLVKNCPNQGWLGGCNDCGVEYNTFQNNGFGAAVFNHNVYLSGSSGRPNRGLHAVGNQLYRSTMRDGRCTGVSLVVHDEQDDLLIDGNTVWEDVGAAGAGCWGIAVDHGGVEAFHRTTIQNNVVANVGNVAIGLNGCIDCVVQNNVILSAQGDFETSAIAIPDARSKISLERIIVRNNSILFSGAAGGIGIVLEGAGQGHVVTSNAVYHAGKRPGFACLSLGLSPDAYAAVDRNLCFAPNAAQAEWERGSGNLSAWQGATGFDRHSTWADPRFASHTNLADALRPSKGSPLVANGDPKHSSSKDRLGKARGATPAIGALEP